MATFVYNANKQLIVKQRFFTAILFIFNLKFYASCNLQKEILINYVEA